MPSTLCDNMMDEKDFIFTKQKRWHPRKREFEFLLLNHMMDTPSEALEFAKEWNEEHDGICECYTKKELARLKEFTNQ